MIKYSWPEFENQINSLAQCMMYASYHPDTMIAISRGGWIPTRYLSDILNTKLIASIGLKYSDPFRTNIVTYSMPSLGPDIEKILLVEDRLETGKSIGHAKSIFEGLGYMVRTCALSCCSKSIVIPDYCIETIDEDVIYPWESDRSYNS